MPITRTIKFLTAHCPHAVSCHNWSIKQSLNRTLICTLLTYLHWQTNIRLSVLKTNHLVSKYSLFLYVSTSLPWLPWQRITSHHCFHGNREDAGCRCHGNASGLITRTRYHSNAPASLTSLSNSTIPIGCHGNQFQVQMSDYCDLITHSQFSLQLIALFHCYTQYCRLP